MNEENEQARDPAEGLLRRWGAEEAARRAEVPDPTVPMRWIGRPPARWRWLLHAAALLFFILGASLFVAVATGWLPDRPFGAPSPSDDSAVSGLRAELKQATEDVRASRSALEAARRRVEEQNREFQAEVARLRRTFETEKADLAAEAERRAAALNKLVGQEQSLRETAVGQLKQRDARLARLGQDLAQAGRSLAELRGQVAAQAARLQEAEDGLVTVRRDAEKRISAIQAQQAAMRTSLEQTYLAATPGEDALGMYQSAVRRRRLIVRCQHLRAQVPNEATRRLLDTLEVLLTRLELMQAGGGDLTSLVRLIRTLGLTRQINEVILTGEEEPDVRAWLMETQLLLKGVERAG